MNRLPSLPQTTDSGFVYVAQRGEAYKIGFSRTISNVYRRCRTHKALLSVLIATGQRPSDLKYILNNHFSDKRLPPQGSNDGDKREWFALTASDLDWLRGLSAQIQR